MLMAAIQAPFLILSALMVGLAASLVYFQHIPIDLLNLSLCLIASLCAHASINLLNEYYDFKSGLYQHTQRSFFHHGSGVLYSRPELATQLKTIAYALLAIAVLIGIYFTLDKSIELIFLGTLGVAVVLLFNSVIQNMPLLGLIVPGLGFAIVMLMGTYVVLTGDLHRDIYLISMPNFLLVNNLLLFNQYANMATDKKAGKRPFIIVYGLSAGRIAYLMQLLITTSFTIYLINDLAFALIGLLLLLPITLSVFAFVGLSQLLYVNDVVKLSPYLALNVVATFSYPAILALLLYFY